MAQHFPELVKLGWHPAWPIQIRVSPPKKSRTRKRPGFFFCLRVVGGLRKCFLGSWGADPGAPVPRFTESLEDKLRTPYIVCFWGIFPQGLDTILGRLIPVIKIPQKLLKFLKKGIDKWWMGWYSNKAVGAEALRQGLKSLILKKLQKRAWQTPCDVVT